MNFENLKKDVPLQYINTNFNLHLSQTHLSTMKKRVFLFLLLTLSSVLTFAQEYTYNYGKVTDNELSMKVYKPDSTTSAVTIYKNVIAKYSYKRERFIIEYNYETKIKVLKPGGVKYADIKIPVYDKGKSDIFKESVSKIEAYAYNLENGKVNKTKMDKSYIFEERVTPYYKQIKFSIPAVKEGTVIEYKYLLTSEFPHQIEECVFQQDIPVIYSNYDVTIPQYFDFNVELKGKEKINVSESVVEQSANGENEYHQTYSVRFNSRRIFLTVINLPAIKDEPNIWCPDDFRTKVTFELKGTRFPGSDYKPYTSTWEDIDELLKKDEDFGAILNMSNPFKEEMRTANILSLPNKRDKIRAIFQLLKSKISWDGTYRFYGSNVKKALKSGTGSNADINFILMSMLKDAGIESFPVMMSKRDLGRLPNLFPSINKLNTFIVAINDDENSTVYLDGSVTNGDINILPPVLMVEKARIFDQNGKGSWVDLTNIGKNSVTALTSGTITPEGIVNGEQKVSYTGEQAYKFRKLFNEAKDSTSFIEKKELEYGISIKKSSFSEVNSFTSNVKEQFSFTKELSHNDDHIYINPLIFPHLTENQFTKEERKLPVEFDYPYTFKQITTLNIPEGYQVEEIPKPVMIHLDNDGCICTYNVQVLGNTIQVGYTFSLNRIFYNNDEYPALRQLWGTVVNKNTELLVLRKATSQPTKTEEKQTSQL